jgi:hypothetical protein
LKTRALPFLEKAKRLQVAGDERHRSKKWVKKSEGSAVERLGAVVFENTQGMIAQIIYIVNTNRGTGTSGWGTTRAGCWESLTADEVRPTCTQRNSLTKECGWKDGDRDGPARTQCIHRQEEEKTHLTHTGLLMEGLEHLNYLGIQRNTRKLNPRDNKLTKAVTMLELLGHW